MARSTAPLGDRPAHRRGHPLTGATRDYEPLLDLIGGARLVLLGEASHGTHDYAGTVTAADDWDTPAERKQVRPGLPGSFEALLLLPLRGHPTCGPRCRSLGSSGRSGWSTGRRPSG